MRELARVRAGACETWRVRELAGTRAGACESASAGLSAYDSFERENRRGEMPSRSTRKCEAPAQAPPPAATCTATSPHRRPLPRCRHAHSRTPPTSTHPLAHTPTACYDSRSSRRNSVVAHAMPHAPLPLPSVLFANATRAAPAALGPLCTTARTQRLSLLCRTSHASPTAHGDLAARTALFPCSGSPPFSWPAVFYFFLLAAHCAARHACLRTHTHARTRMHGRPTNER